MIVSLLRAGCVIRGTYQLSVLHHVVHLDGHDDRHRTAVFRCGLERPILDRCQRVVIGFLVNASKQLNTAGETLVADNHHEGHSACGRGAWSRGRFWSLGVIVFLLFPGLLSAQGDVHAIADKVDQRYNHLQTLEAQFSETYSGAGMTRKESGTLTLKKPGRMRWDYDQPRPKMFLTDGTTAWFYVPGERQVRRAPVKQLDDLRSPLRYLLGKTKLEK